MKKLLAILLAAVMLLACIPALAEASGPKTHFADLGLDVDITAITDKCVYTASFETEGMLSQSPYIAVADVYYCAVTKAQMQEMYKKFEEGSEEEKYEIYNYLAPLKLDIGYILVTDLSDADVAEIMAYDGVTLTDGHQIREFATLEGYHYYYIAAPTEDYLAMFDDLAAIGMTMTEEEAKAMKDEVQADIRTVGEAVEAALRDVKPFVPYDPSNDLVGQVFRFETIDLDGNPVKSEDLFKDNRITMINIWGTWCPSCVSELADLAKIHTRLQEKGCGIVGLEEEQGKSLDEYREAAVSMMTANGITYPNVQTPVNNPVMQTLMFLPTSIFVDSTGKILCVPVIGPRVEDYERIIDELLAGNSVDVVPDNSGVVNGDNKYTVTVFDQDGKPVEGVMIQLCDDQGCAFQPTDADGVATFKVDPKVYDIHVLQVPEGFREDTQSYKTLEEYCNVDIFLKRAE